LPFYQFECKKCKAVYEDLCSYDKSGKYPDVKCPHCKSKSKTKLMSACNYTFANPVDTDRWNSDSSGHDYRFKHNLPNVIEQRKNAELANRGALPYNPINDLGNDNAWGEVK